ncbi:hypothetical protein P3H15_55155, partial [Rhodococcus sp. T2V]|nr:hypothetical protein [Rhodococcus sp. T2V]
MEDVLSVYARRVMPTAYTLHPNEIIGEFGEFGERRCAREDRVTGRILWSEPRSRVREYVTGLVAGLERKNGWTLAERAGEVSPD